MIIMELDTRKSKLKNVKKSELGAKLAKIEGELADETRKSISEVEIEDFGDEAILVPVDNVILVERLREGKAKERKDKLKERKEKLKERKEKLKERKEKEAALDLLEKERKEKEDAMEKVKRLEFELKKFQNKENKH